MATKHHRLARAVRDMALRAATHQHPPNLSAIVRRLDPLTVEVTHGGITLDETEFMMTHAVRMYDWQHGIAVGDVLLLTPSPQGDYHASAVIAVASQHAGMKHPHATGGGTLGGGGTVTVGGTPYSVAGGGTPLVGTVPYYDKDGKKVGDIPLV